MSAKKSESRIRIRRSGSGFAAEGPRFYVWASDREEVARLAQELAKGSYGLGSSRPTVMIRSGPRRIRIADPEALDD